VPEGWVWCRLKDIARIGTGSTPLTSDSSYYAEGKIPWINSSTTNDPFVNSASNYITEKALKETNCTVYPIGTLIVAMYGEGKTRGQLSELNIEAATNQACAAIQLFLKERAFVDFIKYCIQNNYEKLRSESKGGNQPNLNLTIISNFLVPIPPFSEQGRIVSVIRSAFNLTDTIDENKRIIEQLIKQVKSKTLDLSVRGKLVPHDPKVISASILLERIRNEKKAKKTTADISHYPYDLPENWIWRLIAEISVSIQYGYTGTAISSGKYKMLRITDIQNNSVEWNSVPFVNIDDTKAENYLLHNNDIVFARTGATVGKSFLISHLEEKSIFASYLIRIRLKETLNAQYVKYFFESNYYWEQIENKSVGTGQPNVNGTLLSELKIPIPPIDEQQRIVTQIKGIFTHLDSIEKTIKAQIS
jgi:type I restriction enzyme S subunit